MSTTTEKLGLIKPELSDPANITITNGNWDKIEEEFTNLEGKMTSFYSYGTTDLTAGTSQLETGKLYFVYE